MMRIVNTTAVFKQETDPFWIIPKMKQLGYQYLDLALDYYCTPGHPFTTNGCLAWAQALRECAEVNGVQFVQCHGVSSPKNLYESKADVAWNAIKVAEILGAKWIVMHPTDFPGKQIPEFDGYFSEMNAMYLKPFAEEAGTKGVGVAIENMPWANGNRAKPLADMVDLIDLPNMGVCWDTGHAHINQIPPDELRILGSRLVTLHIQDNHGEPYDEHLIPFHGTYDWHGFMRILKEINYKGDLILETHHEPQDAANAGNFAEVDRLIQEMYNVSEKLIRLYV